MLMSGTIVYESGQFFQLLSILHIRRVYIRLVDAMMNLYCMDTTVLRECG